MRVHTVVVPPGGWFFIQQGLTEPIVGTGHEDLLQQITQARITNGLPMGNVSAEFSAQFCARNPTFCSPDAGHNEDVSTSTSFRERVSQWVWNRFSRASNIVLEDQETADARAKVCATCPHNQQWEDSCPCVSAITQKIAILSQARTTNPKVSGCALCGHSNELAVFLGKDDLKHREKYDLPDQCWMNDLKEPIVK